MNDRPKVEYENRDFSDDGVLVVRLSRAKLSVPRYSILVGCVGREGPERLRSFVPFERLDDVIALLGKIRGEHAARIREEIEAARKEADERRARWQTQNDARQKAFGKADRKRKRKWDDGKPTDFSKAERNRERARREQEKVRAAVLGGGS